MTKLERDTRIVGKDNTYRARLHPDWQVWFPNGGYMAAILLRAVGVASTFNRPLSFTCHFLSVPQLGEVDISVASAKRTRNAESLTFSMSQNGKLIIQGMAWTGREVDGYMHDDFTMPKVPHYESLKSTADIAGALVSDGLWVNLEQRPVKGNTHWLLEKSEAAVQRDWLKFATDELDEDPYLNAGRYLVLLDSYGWPAAARRHVGDPRYIAPTLSLTVDFHRMHDSHWMLLDSHGPLSEAGYMKIQNSLWSEDGKCLATGMATLMCRPRPGYEG